MLNKIKNKYSKFKKWLFNKDTICDLLLITSLLIIFFTTLRLNVYIAMYLLAIILLALAIFIFKCCE